MKSWKDIPAMPTVAFKELVLASFPKKRCVKIFRTSGTSRVGRGVHFFDTLKLYEAAIVPSFRENCLPDRAALSYFFLVRSPKDAPDSSLSHMMGVVKRCFARGRGRFYVKKERMLFEKLLQDLKKTKQQAFILSTAFSLKSFLDYLASKKLRLKLPAESRLMETGGFKGKAKEISRQKFYTLCEKYLGIQKIFCVSEYGMTELSSQFYDLSGCFTGPAWTRTVVIDPRTGREVKRGSIGILKHFDLANRGSVMAIQTEDLGKAVGHGFKLLGRAPQSELRGCSLSYEEFLKADS